MSKGGQLSVAYLVSQFPAFSHAFISNEVESMRARGWDVHTFSVTRPSLPDDPSTRPTFVLQAHVIRNGLRVAGDVIRSPGSLVSAVRIARELSRGGEGRRSGLWKQLAYAYESLILLNELRRRRICHVHVHFANSAADIARFASRIGAGASAAQPTWSMTVHGPTDFERAEALDLRGKAASAAAIFCISEFARDELSRLVDARDHARLEICRMGITRESLDPRPDAGSARSDDALHVLFVGRLVDKKDPVGLVTAMSALAGEPANVSRSIHLTVIGDGPLRGEVERAAATAPPNLTVALLGAQPHDRVLDAYGDADVFCLPSFAEGLPVVLMEALAARLAVVATSIAAIPELVVDGESGLLVPPGDPVRLGTALQALWGDRELRRRLGAGGRALVEARYDSAKTTEILSDRLSALLS